MNHWKFLKNLTGYLALMAFLGLTVFATIALSPNASSSTSMDDGNSMVNTHFM